MKKLSVFASLLLIFCMCLTGYASEISEETTVPEETTLAPEVRYLCDADGDGNVTASDARTILRNSVGLDSIEGISLAYSDADMNGSIGAADARLALRTSVELEQKQEYAFSITDMKAASCTEGGYIKAKCEITQKAVEVAVPKRPHSIPASAYCSGEGVCTLCSQKVKVEIRHDFESDYQADKKICRICHLEEPLQHKHSYNSDHRCVCGKAPMTAFAEDVKNYLITYGEVEYSAFYVNDFVDPLSFSLVYDSDVGFPYVYCGFGVQSEGVILYYDFYFDFEDYTIEMIAYTQDGATIAYAYGDVLPALIDVTATGDGVVLTEFETVPELSGYEAEFRQMMEGAVCDSVLWLKGYAGTLGCTYIDHVFVDYTQIN